MDAKYIRAYETFSQSTEKVAVELRPSETIKAIWDVIDSGDFFGVIASYNPGTDPETLKDEFEELKREILNLDYSYLEQSYGYQYSDGKGLTSINRSSLFVPSINYKQLIALGKKWKQETIAFGGNGGISVVRVSDEKVIMDMYTEDMKLSWNFLLANQRNIPW